MATISLGINLEFVRHEDKSFEWGVEKAAELALRLSAERGCFEQGGPGRPGVPVGALFVWPSGGPTVSPVVEGEDVEPRVRQESSVEEAVADYRRAVDLDPSNRPARINFGKMLFAGCDRGPLLRMMRSLAKKHG